MKALKIVLVFVVVVLAFFLGCFDVCSAQSQVPPTVSSSDEKSFFGTLQEVRNAKETVLSQLALSGNIKWFHKWDVNNISYLCVLRSRQTVTGRFVEEITSIEFYRQKGERVIHEYTYETDGRFLSMYPIGPHGNLLTIWIGRGFGYFVVLTMKETKITVALEESSRSALEIIDADNDGESELLISEGNFLSDPSTGQIVAYPKTATLYKWTGATYVPIKTVPWETRLRQLTEDTKNPP
jgi:hypothetical protein